MFVREWNKTGSQTAILVHGIASSGATWHRLARDLASQDYHVIAPDLTGHGRSRWLGKYSLESWAEDILSLGIKEPDLVVGHSMGGLIIASIFKQLKPKNIVLIDPMFNFPRIKSVAWVTKTIFRGNLESAKKTEIVPQAKAMKWSDRDIKIAIQNMRKWDASTVNALDYRPDVIKPFLHQGNNTLILRAKNSFLVPKYWEKKINPARTSMVTLKATHNLHIDMYSTFWEHTKDFLGKATSKLLIPEIVTNSIPVFITQPQRVE